MVKKINAEVERIFSHLCKQIKCNAQAKVMVISDSVFAANQLTYNNK